MGPDAQGHSPADGDAKNTAQGGQRSPVAGPGQQDPRQRHLQQQMQLRMQIAANLRRIKHVVIVMSGKGGVGKTTVAVNLAASLAKAGHGVGLLDLDLTNPNAPAMLDLESARQEKGDPERIHPLILENDLKVVSTEFFMQGRKEAIIWRGPIKMNMIKQLLGNVEWGELDYLVVDLPPGTSDEPLTIAQSIPDADGVVLVTTPQEVSVLDVKKSLAFAQTMDLPVLGVVENMAGFACPHCGEETHVFGHGGAQKLTEEHGVPVLGSIPLEPRIVQGSEEGVPYVWGSPDTPTGKAFAQVVEALKGRLEDAAGGE